MNVIIVGGGPAGMMSAITSAQEGNNVIILEKMNSCGKKLLITGKGRCNITNSASIDDFFKNIPGNSRFLYSAFNSFNNEDVVNFMENQGVKTKVERGGRIFPVSDKAVDVRDAFLNKLRELKVKIITNCKVEKILVEEGIVKGIEAEEGQAYLADKVILATGGKSYPVTGSTGDGYVMASKLGHIITPIKPALVPLICNEKVSLEMCKEMQGLSLRNIAVKLMCANKTIYEDFGEMLFTHLGVSGPVILSGSSILLRYKNVDNLLKQNEVKLQIDLKPALDKEKLDLRIRRDFEEVKNKQYKNSLDHLLPQKMIPVFIKYTKINPEKKVNEITKEERRKIVECLKCFEIVINGFGRMEEAIVTAGGVSTKEINPKTMESKLVQGLYFAGEIIDVDALTRWIQLTNCIFYRCMCRKGKLMEFRTINKNVTAEIVEKKSRFIANVFYIESVQEAEEYIKNIKKKYHDAKHNCFAYVVTDLERECCSKK